MRQTVFVLDAEDPDFELIKGMLLKLKVTCEGAGGERAKDSEYVAVVLADTGDSWGDTIDTVALNDPKWPVWVSGMKVIVMNRGRIGRFKGFYQNLRRMVRVACGLPANNSRVNTGSYFAVGSRVNRRGVGFSRAWGG